MNRSKSGKSLILALAGLLLVPLAASAQSSIVGLVRDESGGVLPGVAVEAASPVLIEKVRTVVTNDQGRYTIVDLRPGTYRVMFTLTGFGTVVRDGIELPSNFTATVSADLKVGSLQETVTVSGAAPMVDVQQAQRTQVMTRDMIDVLPVSRNVMSIGMLVPGVRMGSQDVGGSQILVQTSPRVHGVWQPESVQMVDGMSIQSNEDCVCQAYQDDAIAAEISVTTSALPAEISGGGMRTNTIPKDGGNIMSGTVFLGGSEGKWQNDNVDDYLRSRNIRKSDKISHVQVFNASWGGPVVKDTLWYFMTARHIAVDKKPANVEVEYIVAPNGEVVRAVNDQHSRNANLRLTWQVTPKLKFAPFLQRTWKQLGRDYAFGADPRSSIQRDPTKANNFFGTAKITYAASNKVFIEGGVSTNYQNTTIYPMRGTYGEFIEDRNDPRFMTNVRRQDSALNINYNCAWPDGCTSWGSNNAGRTQAEKRTWYASLSYVTGTHNFKSGLSLARGEDNVENKRNGDLIAIYVNNRPNTVTVYNTPINQKAYVRNDLGIYVQDSWAIKRLTVNPGLRVEWFNAEATEVSLPAGRFAPARWYPLQANMPDWNNDFAPRLSVAYDLFGDGRTALKASVSRYYRQHTGYWTKRYANSGQTTDSRNWFDCTINAAGTACSGVARPADNDSIPQDWEIGPTSSTTFGLRADRNYDPDIQRENNWEYSAAVQHQIISGVSAGFAWYHRTWEEMENSDRTLITTSDYTSFTTPMPSFANDPTIGGALNPNEVLTVYNLNRAKRSVYGVALLDSNSDNQSIYNGFETSVTARFPWGSTLFASWTFDRNLSVFCASDDNPNGVSTNDWYLGDSVHNGGRFCDQRKWGVPFMHEFKFSGNLPLPYGLDMGAVLQSYGGKQRTITYAPAASLFPGGRTNSETLILNEPGSLYYPRYNQLDVNIKKTFRSGRKTYTVQMDYFNVLNANAIMTANDAIGASLGQVLTVMYPRFPRIAFQMKW